MPKFPNAEDMDAPLPPLQCKRNLPQNIGDIQACSACSLFWRLGWTGCLLLCSFTGHLL